MKKVIFFLKNLQNENYTILCCAKLSDCNLDKINLESGSIISKWGINPDDTGNYLRISSADEIIYEEKTSAPIHQNGLLGVLDGLERVAYEAYIDTEMSIVINDNQYFTQDTGIAFFI